MHINPLTNGQFYRPITQSALGGSKQFFMFFSLGHPQQNALKGHEFSMPKYSLNKGQTPWVKGLIYHINFDLGIL